jgi:hypothetical protein
MCVVGVSRLSIKDLKVEVDRFLNHHIHLTSQGKLVPMLWHHHIGLFQSLLPLCFNLTFGRYICLSWLDLAFQVGLV